MGASMKFFLLASLLLIGSPAMATDWYILDMINQRCVTVAHFADETGQPSFSSPLQLRAFGRARPETGHTGTVVHHLQGISTPGNFMVIHDPAFFAQAQSEEWGDGLSWSDGLDLGADQLYSLGRHQAGLPAREDFVAWRKRRNQLSLSQAAQAIGMTRRMIAYYNS